MLLIICSVSVYSKNWGRVIHAIAKVESNHNPKAKNGIYAGYLQIAPIIVNDCNRILKIRKIKKSFTLNDRYDKNKSIEMFIIIQSFYNKKGNVERAIRLWNGGPNYSITKTQKYYNKVKKHL